MSEIGKEMDTKRLLIQLLKKHKEEYLEVAFKSTGLFQGPINAVSLSAKIPVSRAGRYIGHSNTYDTGLEVRCMYHFSYQEVSEGYVKLKVKKFEHCYDSKGGFVGIECWYQSMIEMTSILVAENFSN